MNLRYFLACLLIVLIWAGSFIFIRIGLNEFLPITLAFLRFAAASIFLSLFYLFFNQPGKSKKLNLKTNFLKLNILALTGVSLLYIFQFYSLKFISATIGSIMINSTTIFMALLSAAFLNEKLNKRKVLGILIAFIGVSILVSNGWRNIEFYSNQFLGGTLMLGAALCWAIYSVVSKKVLQFNSSLTITLVAFLLGTVHLFPMAFILENPIKTIFNASKIGWLSVFYLAFLSSALAYFLWNEILMKSELTKVGAILYIIPIPTMIFEYFLLKEPITKVTLIGAFLVITGVYLTESA
ncbi:MAG: DMT family transporter [Candidatus Bathyarchaeia archaeon]|nr:DMT family transporter [Candidatus Bathyarchaeota archaeon]